MGGLSVKIDLGDALPYLEDRVRRVFGKDVESIDLAKWLRELQQTAIKLASKVNCVGMRPLPFQSIYQPTRLRVTGRTISAESFVYENRTSRSIALSKAIEGRELSVDEFLEVDDDAIIFAGPGWGKTTFMHHVYRKAVQDTDLLPILITLSRPGAVEDLERFVREASRISRNQDNVRTLLLVDGYDEVPASERRRVSNALIRYEALEIGRYYLSCREYYQVSFIAAPHVHIGSFDKDDQYRFVRVFLSHFGSKLDAMKVVDELEARNMGDFLSHPLLLALACIVRTSQSAVQPRSSLRLLERALDLLCYRWDDLKQIDRENVTPLDGKDRIHVLERIAYVAKSRHLPDHRAIGIAQKHLDRMSFERIDARRVLMETAQFYGILVPSDDGWEFVHRTLHDFLAARFWVQSGDFAKVRSYEWDSRTAYAACQLSDSTEILLAALASEDGLPTVTEIISNAPQFDLKSVAGAVLKFYSKPGMLISCERSESRVSGLLEYDFIRLSSKRFINELIETCTERRTPVGDVVVAYCLDELRSRGTPADFTTYQKLQACYENDRFTFCVFGGGQTQLGLVNPAVPNTEWRKLTSGRTSPPS